MMTWRNTIVPDTWFIAAMVALCWLLCGVWALATPSLGWAGASLADSWLLALCGVLPLGGGAGAALIVLPRDLAGVSQARLAERREAALHLARGEGLEPVAEIPPPPPPAWKALAAAQRGMAAGQAWVVYGDPEEPAVAGVVATLTLEQPPEGRAVVLWGEDVGPALRRVAPGTYRALVAGHLLLLHLLPTRSPLDAPTDYGARTWR